jgi:hypothetical protein
MGPRWLQTLVGALVNRFPPSYRVLLTIEVFTGDRVGAAGRTPAHLTAWRELLSDKNADAYFKSLLSNATLPGQLYGLAGLYYTDRPSLTTLATPYLKRQDAIKTMVACFVADTPVSEIVERIVDGAWPDVLRRGASGVPDWLARRRLTSA